MHWILSTISIFLILFGEVPISTSKKTISTFSSFPNLNEEGLSTLNFLSLKHKASFISTAFDLKVREKEMRCLWMKNILYEDYRPLQEKRIFPPNFTRRKRNLLFSSKEPLDDKKNLEESFSEHESSNTQGNQIYIKHFINLTNGLEILPSLKKQVMRKSASIQDNKFLRDGKGNEGLEEKYPYMNDFINIREISFIRIQSSRCESNDLDGILSDLDHNLLINLALGIPCIVYDCGSRGTKWPDDEQGISWAIWSGLSWIKYALKRCWISPSSSSMAEEKNERNENKKVDNIQEEGKNQQRKIREKEKTVEPILVRGYDVSPMYSRRYDMLPKKLKKKLRYYRHYVNPNMKDVPLFAAYKPTTMDGEYDKYAEILRSEYIPYLSTASDSQIHEAQSNQPNTSQLRDISTDKDSRMMSYDELQDQISNGDYLPEGFRLYNSKIYDTATGRYQKKQK